MLKIGIPLIEKILKSKTEDELLFVQITHENWVDGLICKLIYPLLSDIKSILSIIERCNNCKVTFGNEVEKKEIIQIGIDKIRELLEK